MVFTTSACISKQKYIDPFGFQKQIMIVHAESKQKFWRGSALSCLPLQPGIDGYQNRTFQSILTKLNENRIVIESNFCFVTIHNMFLWVKLTWTDKDVLVLWVLLQILHLQMLVKPSRLTSICEVSLCLWFITFSHWVHSHKIPVSASVTFSILSNIPFQNFLKSFHFGWHSEAALSVFLILADLSLIIS